MQMTTCSLLDGPPPICGRGNTLPRAVPSRVVRAFPEDQPSWLMRLPLSQGQSQSQRASGSPGAPVHAPCSSSAGDQVPNVSSFHVKID